MPEPTKATLQYSGSRALVWGADSDVTQAENLLNCCLRHMVKFKKKQIEQNKSMDTYLNEAFSMAAEHIYEGPIE
ncbi:hypothetical protein ERX40_07695 [Macrococcus carouselicus]|uniref:Uncharacterized protein n=2 Tax=Macrococcus carouselicus TaxID=69969 RepID=A0A9Q8CH12_9STAP|nr:hypothetical protein ERX40_07695 [Macrococcus carouselicus]